MFYLTQGIHRALRINAEGRATIFGERVHTWREFAHRVSKLASAFRALGLAAGDRVSMLALNSDRYIEYYYAVLWAGGVVVPVNTRWSVREIAYSIDDTSPMILLFDRAFISEIEQLRNTCTVAHYIFADDGAPPEWALNYEVLLAGATPIDDACGSNDDLATIMFTGGTTGVPKGVMLSHQGVMVDYLSCAPALAMSEKSIMLHSAPLFHMAAGWTVFGATAQCATHAVIPAFSAVAMLEAIKQHQPTHLLLVPTMVKMIMDEYDARGGDLSSVETLAYGASPMAEGLLTRVMEAFPGVRMVNAYGQTELSPAATLLLPEHHVLEGKARERLHSVGRPIAAVDVKVVDGDGQTCNTGVVGEICVRGPTTMLGYWNKVELTRTTKIDGWVHTGDAGYFDEGGFLFLVDRVKDMIISGGENVYSAEVENALMLHETVGECAVFGVPDDKWGERVHAIIVPRPGYTVEIDALLRHCREQIATYKCPRSMEIWSNPLPLTGAGKIMKAELRAAFWKESKRNVN